MRRLSATLVLLAAAGCASTPPVVTEVVVPPPPPVAPGPPPPTIERLWRLAYLDGAPETLPVGATLELKAAETGLTAKGFAGCGEFEAPAPLTGISLRIDAVAPAVPPECAADARVMQNQFVAALTATRRVTIRGGYLVLVDEFGKERAYFTPG